MLPVTGYVVGICHINRVRRYQYRGEYRQYDYTVTNDTLSIDIEEFSIYFDSAAYTNLATVTDLPAGWDSLVIQPELSLPTPDDGFYDSLALISGIAPGDVLGGFSVMFDFIGSGMPGAQSWEILNPFTFATLDQGVTVSNAVTPVPEPDMRWLLLVGLLAGYVANVRRSTINRVKH